MIAAVVFPHSGSGEESSSIGMRFSPSIACAAAIQSAAASACAGLRITWRRITSVVSTRSTAPSTGDGHGSGSSSCTSRPCFGFSGFGFDALV